MLKRKNKKIDEELRSQRIKEAIEKFESQAKDENNNWSQNVDQNIERVMKKRERIRTNDNVEGLREITNNNNSDIKVRSLLMVLGILCAVTLKVFYLNQHIVSTSDVLSIYMGIMGTYMLAVIAMFALFDTKLLGKSVYYYAQDLLNTGNISNFFILNILLILAIMFKLYFIFIILMSISIVFTTGIVTVIFIVNFEVTRAVDNTQSVYEFLSKNVFRYRNTTRSFWEDILKISYTADEKSKIQFQILMDEITLNDFPEDDLIKQFLEKSNAFSNQDDIGVVIIKKFIKSVYLKRIDFIEEKKEQTKNGIFKNREISDSYFESYYKNKLQIFSYREFFNLAKILDSKTSFLLFTKNIEMVKGQMSHVHADQELLLDNILDDYDTMVHDYQIIRIYDLISSAGNNQISALIKKGILMKNQNILNIILEENLLKTNYCNLSLNDVFEIFGLIEGAKLKNKETNENYDIINTLIAIEKELVKQYMNDNNKELKNFDFSREFSLLYRSYIKSLTVCFIKVNYNLDENKNLWFIVNKEAKRILKILENTGMNISNLSKENYNYLVDIFQNKNFLKQEKINDPVLDGRALNYYENIILNEYMNKKYNLGKIIIKELKEIDQYDYWNENLLKNLPGE